MNSSKDKLLIYNITNLFFSNYKAFDQQNTTFMSTPNTSIYNYLSNELQENQCDCNTIKRLEDEQKLTNNAKRFIEKIRNRKKLFEGRMLILKRAEQQKRIKEEKRLQASIIFQREVEKSNRKLRAQRNIQFMNERKNLRQSTSSSPKKRRLSSVTEEQIDESLKIRLPPLHEPQLSQIKEQLVESTPLGLKKTTRKPIIKRSLTEHTRREISDQLQPAKKLSPKRKKSKQSTEHDHEKKQYLIKRHRTEQISQYIQRFNEINKLIETKSKKSWGEPSSGKKNLTPKSRNLNEFSASSRSRNIE